MYDQCPLEEACWDPNLSWLIHHYDDEFNASLNEVGSKWIPCMEKVWNGQPSSAEEESVIYYDPGHYQNIGYEEYPRQKHCRDSSLIFWFLE